MTFIYSKSFFFICRGIMKHENTYKFKKEEDYENNSLGHDWYG